MAIDWNGSRKAWNRDHGTKFEIRKEFLTALDNEYTVEKISKLLYISHPTIRRAMREDGIPPRPKGHRFTPPGVKKIMALNTETLTRTEIARKTGLTKMYIFIVLKKLGRSCKKEVT